MKRPSLFTRLIGTPLVAVLLYIGAGLALLGWANGEVSGWLAGLAFCSAVAAWKSVRQNGAYKKWWSAWQAMGPTGERPQESPSPPASKGKRPRWPVMMEAVLLIVIPASVGSSGVEGTPRELLTLLWCGIAIHLICRLVRGTWRRVFGSAWAASASETKSKAVNAVVQWALPRASSSPSRAEFTRKLPDYCARLIAPH